MERYGCTRESKAEGRNIALPALDFCQRAYTIPFAFRRRACDDSIAGACTHPFSFSVTPDREYFCPTQQTSRTLTGYQPAIRRYRCVSLWTQIGSPRELARVCSPGPG